MRGFSPHGFQRLTPGVDLALIYLETCQKRKPARAFPLAGFLSLVLGIDL